MFDRRSMMENAMHDCMTESKNDRLRIKCERLIVDKFKDNSQPLVCPHEILFFPTILSLPTTKFIKKKTLSPSLSSSSSSSILPSLSSLPFRRAPTPNHKKPPWYVYFSLSCIDPYSVIFYSSCSFSFFNWLYSSHS